MPTGSRFASTQFVFGLAVMSLAAVAFSAAPQRLAAQGIEGTVVEEGTGVVVTGGFVVLIDEAGAQHDADLTDEAGRFGLAAPGAGSYRLGLDRIGYLSVMTPLFPLAAGQSIEYRLTAIVEPVDLAAIDIRTDAPCHVRPAENLEVARVWEEARKALTATAWTQREGLLSYTVVARERTLEPRTLAVRKEESRSRRGVSRGSPYVALSADRLAREGYAKIEDDVQTYYAPDAITLLSNSFLDRHCLRLRPPEEADPGLVGVAFEPVGVSGLPDIEGTLWLDEVTAELDHLEFRYTGLPRSSEGKAGGDVEFERLPSGQWIVRRWRILMPVVRGVSDDVYDHLTMDPSRRPRMISIQEDSGEVTDLAPALAVHDAEAIPLAERPVEVANARVAPGGSCSAAGIAGTAELRGAVRDSATGVALPGARVTLTWGGRAPGSASGLTDATGRYAICGVPSGIPVTAVAAFPHRRAQTALTLTGSAASAEMDFAITGSDAVEGSRIESELGLATGPAGDGPGVAAGRVVDAVTGEALAGAGISLPGLGRGTVSAGEGEFRLEGVPPGRHRLTVELLGYETAGSWIDAGGGPVSATARLVPSPIALAALEIRIPGQETETSRARGEGRYVLTSAEIPANTTLTIGELLARRLPGLRHGTRGGCPVLRTRDGVVGLVVLDDQRFYDTCVLQLIRPEDVERIELLPSLAAGLEYGTSAGGGVLVVTTKR